MNYNEIQYASYVLLHFVLTNWYFHHIHDINVEMCRVPIHLKTHLM